MSLYIKDEGKTKYMNETGQIKLSLEVKVEHGKKCTFEKVEREKGALFTN